MFRLTLFLHNLAVFLSRSPFVAFSPFLSICLIILRLNLLLLKLQLQFFEFLPDISFVSRLYCLSFRRRFETESAITFDQVPVSRMQHRPSRLFALHPGGRIRPPSICFVSIVFQTFLDSRFFLVTWNIVLEAIRWSRDSQLRPEICATPTLFFHHSCIYRA